jgi:glucan phosphorylase
MTGDADFAFNSLFMGRSETSGIWSQQIQNGQGLLNTPTVQNFNFRLVSARMEYSIPYSIPVKLYGATAWGVNKVSASNLFSSFHNGWDNDAKNVTTFLWSAGVHYSIGQNLADVYIPVISSQNILDAQKDNNIKWFQSITFRINLSTFNPFEIVGKTLSKLE